ncbi:MAG TPA: site-specific DNA-methyltransferase [candidate division Zixibacteria bacterium]|nr:site-specific DNA-methyltransferase [candidate division Zixibacteria bacterium]
MNKTIYHKRKRRYTRSLRISDINNIYSNNLLIYGDNVTALKFLSTKPEVVGKVRLIYIDPPYGTKQNFTISGDRFTTISRMNGGHIAYKDTLTGEEYLKFLSARLKLMKDIMADDGSIYLHIDSKMGHYVKVLMDNIFGQKNFINDITRIKCNPKNFDRKGYGNIKDMILFYSKTKKYVWNNPRNGIEIGDKDSRFNYSDADGRKFTTTPIHAPGETENGPTGKKWRGKNPPPGRHWRYSPEVLDELDRKGLLHWSSKGNPRKKIYADDIMKNGVKMQDIWEYKDPQVSRYPTEKNLDMLKKIIEASSNSGDIVMDAFCGSGTTLVSAQALGRKWIGIDSSSAAMNICKRRLMRYDFLDIAKECSDE